MRKLISVTRTWSYQVKVWIDSKPISKSIEKRPLVPTEVKQGAAAAVISYMKRNLIFAITFLAVSAQAQDVSDTVQVYKKKVLESIEVDFLMSYYSQDGDNSAVGGGIGTEELTDLTPTFVVAIPLNDDDVLTIDAGISAYSSASSSNINPFDGNGTAEASPFQASSGASRSDIYGNLTGSYSHSSDDRNSIWTGQASVAFEYDYVSFGVGGSYTKLFNQKNTEVSIKGNVFLDTWSAIYPIELRSSSGGDDNDFNLNNYIITGNPNYNPVNFSEFSNEGRNSYSVGLSFSQILSKNMKALVSLDVVRQDGLLSTPYQRVYFSDVADSFIEGFQLADDVERLPDNRLKIAAGGRLNYYINEKVSLRTYYRFYNDDWGINSHTASISIPIKLNDKFTFYPNYRYYTQTEADYFGPYETHVSTSEFYTSDYDLSQFNANQYGFGVGYTDIFTKTKLFKFGIKSIDLKFNYYERNTGLSAFIISGGIKFVLDK